MLKLDLGAGPRSPEGFTPLGHAHGSEIYPLRVADNDADVIRASHCLEHFPHREVPKVLADWVRALKPGGELLIAVPNFEKAARDYLDGVAQPTEGYVMGGQIDGDDFHKAIFDEAHLRGLMAQAGLILVEPWISDIQDCAALPISLNLKGRKPLRPPLNLRAVMSTPRLGFNDMWQSAIMSLVPLGISLVKVTGAFWDQCMTGALEDAIADPSVDYVLGIDYDSVFNPADVIRLVETVRAYPNVDALAPLQASRHNGGQLFGIRRERDGIVDFDRETLEQDLFPVTHAHFGLSLVNAEKLRNLPRPWFWTTPDADGRYGDGHTDPDINFWRRWEAAGNTLYLAPRVVIGHIEVMVRWPDLNMQQCWQSAKDWDSTRRPPENVWTGRP